MCLTKLYLANIISTNSTASTYNGNINKRLATLDKKFAYKFCLPENFSFCKILRFNLVLYGMLAMDIQNMDIIVYGLQLNLVGK